MQKRHFEAIAKALLAARPLASLQMEQWKEDVMAIAKVCEAHNEHFNLQRFLKACGWE